MARRLMQRLPAEQRQKGFKPEEGVAANTTLLKRIFAAAKARPTPLYAAFIDFRKAFDSVGHVALLRALRRAGLSADSANYLRDVYSKISTTVLGRKTKIQRGVCYVGL